MVSHSEWQSNRENQHTLHVNYMLIPLWSLWLKFDVEPVYLFFFPQRKNLVIDTFTDIIPVSVCIHSSYWSSKKPDASSKTQDVWCTDTHSVPFSVPILNLSLHENVTVVHTHFVFVFFAFAVRVFCNRLVIRPIIPFFSFSYKYFLPLT